MINVSRASTPPSVAAQPPITPTPSSMPHTELGPVPSGPARDRVRPLLDASVRDRIPQAAFDVRIGRGTVASEFDRNVRVRLVGDGPPSTRQILPETSLTKRLMDSPAGASFQSLVRHTAAVADAAQGNDDLKTLTFAPDEHAVKAAEFMNSIIGYANEHPGRPVRFTNSHDPKVEKAAAQSIVKEASRDVPQQLSFSAAWNGGGNILVAPDVSRDLFATIGAYRFQKGDRVADAPAAKREAVLRDDWDTLVHETHHSVSPMQGYGNNEKVNILEEAISSVFGRNQRWSVARAAKADITGAARRPDEIVDNAKLGWSGWNRAHLPPPPKDLEDTAGGRYVSGPETLRDLLKLAGVDLRTNAGKTTAFELLQSKQASQVPRLLATAIAGQHGMPESSIGALTRAVLDSMQDGSAKVRAMLPKDVSAT